MNHRLTLPIAFFIGLTLAITVFLIVPTVRDIRRLNTLITEERLRLEARYTRRRTVRNAIEFVESVAREFPALRSVAVKEGSEIDLVSAVEAIAERTGVTHQIRLTPTGDGARKGYDRRLEVDIDMRGDGRAVALFIEELERLPPAFLDKRFTMNAQGDGSTVSAVFRAAVSWSEQQ